MNVKIYLRLLSSFSEFGGGTVRKHFAINSFSTFYPKTNPT